MRKIGSPSRNQGYDGGNHKISGLYINDTPAKSTTYYGLFGVVEDGTIKNLTISGEITLEPNGTDYNGYVGGPVLPPRWYWAIHYGSGSCNYAKYWLCSTVKYILRSSVYLGTVTQNTTGSRSYKDRAAIHKPENEWIIHEEACEAIIPRKVWDIVQERDRQAAEASANNASPVQGLFSGKLVCADCGASLYVNREKYRRKDGTVKQYVAYICGNYTSSGGSVCSWHRINELTLKQIVMREIQAHAKALTLDEAAVLDKLRKRTDTDSADHRQTSRREITKLRCQIQELEQKTAQLYEDKVTGSISAETFSLLAGKTEQERQKKGRAAQCAGNRSETIRAG